MIEEEQQAVLELSHRGTSPRRHAGLDPAFMNARLAELAGPCSWTPDQDRGDGLQMKAANVL